MQLFFFDCKEALQLKRILIVLFVGFLGMQINAQEYWDLNSSVLVDNQEFTSYERLVYWDASQWEVELQAKGSSAPLRIALPNELGALETFILKPTSVLAPEIAKQHPKIKTYTAVSAQRNKVHARVTLSPLGVSAWLRLPGEEDVFIQPEKGTKGQHRIYQKSEAATQAAFLCKTAVTLAANKNLFTNYSQKITQQETLKTFRLAITATGEYTQYWNDDDPSNGDAQEDAFAAVVNTVNRINEVFETDLGIRLQLVTGEHLIYIDAFTDPFTGNLNQEAQSTLTAEVGEANYDIGHLFSQGASSNGDAGCVGCVCQDTNKGQGYSVFSNPSASGSYLNDYFDLDYVAHEMGHQFGAYHTFSHENEGTGSSVEPGSGSTIMGYAGITGTNNVQLHGDPYFHAKSIEQITAYNATVSCYTTTPISNRPPIVDAGPDYHIPIGTAYALQANASDPDGDTLYYTWEQMDDGTITGANFGPENFAGALARSLPPSSSAVRFIPNSTAVLSGALTQTNPTSNSSWETVATVAREMHWAVTVRDRSATSGTNHGRTHRDDMQITVVDTEVPFAITSNNEGAPWKIGARKSITWEVANTNLHPINAETVSIYLSIDDGLTFPYVLAAAAPNTGEAWVTVPFDAETSGARVKIQADNNIFYTLNTVPFEILSRPFYLRFDNYQQLSCNNDAVDYNFTFTAPSNTNASLVAQTLPNGFQITSIPTSLTPNASGSIRITPTVNAGYGPQEVIFRVQNGTSVEDFSIQLEHYSSTILAPELVFPTIGMLDVPLQPVLRWENLDNANAYRVEVSESTNFTAPLLEATTFDTTYTVPNLEPDKEYYWRVRGINSCADGGLSILGRFQTTTVNCKSFTAEGLPLLINDASSVSSGITRKVIFVENDNPIESLEVQLDVLHTYVSDLTMNLIAPNGEKIILVQNTGGSGNNFTNTIFSDTAETEIGSSNPPFSGTFRPLESFEKFKGKSSLGNWTLEIIDSYEQDVGSLVAFSLQFCLQGILAENSDQDTVVDALDNCPFVVNDDQNDYDSDGVGDVCDLDGQNNFSIYKKDESCIGKANGSLQVEVLADFNYTVNLVGPSGYRQNFTMNGSGLTVNNLAAGDYLLCITSPEDTNFERCFSTNIASPELMQVQSVVHEPSQSLDLNVSGTTAYEVLLNGKKVNASLLEQKRIPLQKGANYLKVINTASCQDIFERVVYLSEGFMAYPNPTSGVVNLVTADTVEQLLLTVRAIDGTLLAPAKSYIRTDLGVFSVDLTSFPPGMYLLQIQTENGITTQKIIRK